MENPSCTSMMSHYFDSICFGFFFQPGWSPNWSNWGFNLPQAPGFPALAAPRSEPWNGNRWQKPVITGDWVFLKKSDSSVENLLRIEIQSDVCQKVLGSGQFQHKHNYHNLIVCLNKLQICEDWSHQNPIRWSPIYVAFSRMADHIKLLDPQNQWSPDNRSQLWEDFLVLKNPWPIHVYIYNTYIYT